MIFEKKFLTVHPNLHGPRHINGFKHKCTVYPSYVYADPPTDGQSGRQWSLM